MDYQFLNERKETIKFDGLISNRDIAIRKDLYVEFGLAFSSYPHLNFFIDLKYTVIKFIKFNLMSIKFYIIMSFSIQGTPNHVECNVNLSPSRELKGEQTKVQYSMAKHKTFQGFKLHHRLILLKPYFDLQINYNEVVKSA